MKKKIVVLGSTGSIGTSCLDVIRSFKDKFEVIGLGAGKNIDLLIKQIEEFRPRFVTIINEVLAKELKERLPSSYDIEIKHSKEGYMELASLDEADLIVSAIVGSVGLIPTLSALNAGKDVALANKESLVIAGHLVTKAAKKTGAKILPVDSEHCAIFQCLQGQDKSALKRLILTASGGPFRDSSLDKFKEITPDQAIKHPNWKMGRKISVDSATLMNKGLEIIEARWLFDVDVDKIDVVIHPQSIIHSMVEFVDGSILAQLGITDMRIPIAYALSWPERLELDLPQLDLVSCSPLTFEAPNFEKFPCLRLAYEAVKIGGSMPCILSASNEVAVEAFLSNRIRFDQIPKVIEEVLSRLEPRSCDNLDEIINEDARARLMAEMVIQEFYNK